ncbi:hypothetical protein T07_9289, partial [Trichinella nelsoni]
LNYLRIVVALYSLDHFQRTGMLRQKPLEGGSSEEQADQMISRQVVNVETVATIATTVAAAAPPNLISPRFLDFPVNSQNVYGIAQSIAQIT